MDCCRSDWNKVSGPHVIQVLSAVDDLQLTGFDSRKPGQVIELRFTIDSRDHGVHSNAWCYPSWISEVTFWTWKKRFAKYLSGTLT